MKNQNLLKQLKAAFAGINVAFVAMQSVNIPGVKYSIDQSNKNSIAKERLRLTLEVAGLEWNGELICNTVKRVREYYTTIPNPYPSDAAVYDAIIYFVRKRATLENACDAARYSLHLEYKRNV